MSLPLFTVEQLRAAEATASEALPAGTLMERAGKAAAQLIDARLKKSGGRRIAVVCGGGNNGGDGYVCAAELKTLGYDVACFAIAAAAPSDAIAAARRWKEVGGPTSSLPSDSHFDAVVDGLLGIGLARPLAGAYLDAVRWINKQDSLVLAMDVPSGLDADRGCWLGAVPGVEADATITFIGATPGLFTGDGSDAAGKVVTEALGVSLPPGDGLLSSPADFARVLERRRRNSHKGEFGNVAVVGGGAGMVGAPLLAARAALRMGAGRVFVDCVGARDVRVDPQQPELMFRDFSSLRDIDAWVIGCGLGADAVAVDALERALACVRTACVLDADALNLIATHPQKFRAPLERVPSAVLTPHPLEAARLLSISAADVQSDRVGAARRLAQSIGALVVLKGAGSVIAQPDGRYWINPTGGPALATAGTGDVLAGMIGALIGQKFPPMEAVLAAVWLHGAVADEYGGDIGLTASELPAFAASRLNRLRRGL